ncbi:MAG: adenylate/guanylate cyclase domain-containing protein [Bacteroidota bacterium]
MSSRLKRKLIGVLYFTFATALLGTMYWVLETGLLGDAEYYPSTGNPYDSLDSLGGILGGTLTLGAFVGYLEMFLFERLFFRSGFGLKVLAKGLIYVISTIVNLIVLSWTVATFKYDKPFYEPQVISDVGDFLYDFVFLSILIYAGAGLVLIVFVKEVSNSLGRGTLINFLLGKYHNPRKEERIFMFVDMKSSTTIAEQLGHVTYFELLNSCFSDMTDAILDNHGEVYQYVGDEVILTWPLNRGLKESRYLKCIFEIKQLFIDRSRDYQEHYQVVPDFKAGIHYGEVTAGEMGVIRKEVMFSGDVLNTTARLRDLCKTYETDIIVSEKLLAKTNEPDKYAITSFGEIEVRGRQEKIGVSGVSIET